ncbi:WhiB family transcriptional regulator [Streptomyces goshikiensis]
MPVLSGTRSRPHSDTDPARHWTEKAACAGPASTRFLAAEATAIAICRQCPVRAECLAAALDEEARDDLYSRTGIRGGLTVPERWALRPKTPRVYAAPTGDVEQATALLHAAELTNREITARTRVSAAEIIRLRRALALRPAWAEVAVRFHARTVPGSDGHLGWSGGHGLIVDATHFSGPPVAFRLGYGRDPVGLVRANCGMQGCVAWEHLTDRAMRDAARAQTANEPNALRRVPGTAR